MAASSPALGEEADSARITSRAAEPPNARRARSRTSPPSTSPFSSAAWKMCGRREASRSS